ncbi:MAG: MotA/TolQ/ExbB proton channel family protein [Phycisphaerae bacterium]|nr:MotA/TolQ/ExbB proton channel family protein [Phycisphaerae bacterium]
MFTRFFSSFRGYRGTVVVIAVFLLIFGATATLTGQVNSGDSFNESASEISLWSTVAAGGVIGYLILLMSLVAMAYIIEQFISVRRDRLIPDALIAELEPLIESGKYEEATDLCRKDGSYLGRVVGAGLTQVGAMFGFFDMQNTMQETSEREISRFHRKLEYLSFIASGSPMLGLLGTVTGMIRSFNQIALTEGTARPSQLAGGISEALVTTCMGLVVAIPTMFFVAFFRNRIESYIAEAETVVEKLMGRFRREGVV